MRRRNLNKFLMLDIEKIQDRVEALQSSLEALSDEIAKDHPGYDVSDAFQDADGVLDKIYSDLEDLDSEIDDLEQERDAAESECKEAEANLAELQSSCNYIILERATLYDGLKIEVLRELFDKCNLEDLENLRQIITRRKSKSLLRTS